MISGKASAKAWTRRWRRLPRRRPHRDITPMNLLIDLRRMITSFSDCGLLVNQPPFQVFTSMPPGGSCFTTRSAEAASGRGSKVGRCDLYRAFRQAGMQDIIRSHPNLVLAGPLFRRAELCPDRDGVTPQ